MIFTNVLDKVSDESARQGWDAFQAEWLEAQFNERKSKALSTQATTRSFTTILPRSVQDATAELQHKMRIKKPRTIRKAEIVQSVQPARVA